LWHNAPTSNARAKILSILDTARNINGMWPMIDGQHNGRGVFGPDTESIIDL